MVLGIGWTVLLGCTGPAADDKGGTGLDDTAPAGTATLSAVALSPDEIAATVELSGDGAVTCGAVTVPAVAGASVVYVPGVDAGADVTCVATVGSGRSEEVTVAMPPLASPGTVLFDNAHGETVGNSDWIIDDNSPSPSPSDPSSGDAWSGAYSNFGFDVRALGYDVLTNRSDLDADALADVQVLVLPEPNNRLSTDEEGAIVAFVQRGGGLVLISNHHDSDRDSDGVEPTEVVGDLLEALGATVSQGDSTLDTGNEVNTTGADATPGDPVLHGPQGDVERVDFYEGSGFRVQGLPTDRPLLYRLGHTGDASGGVRAAAAYVGAGRVFCVPDSAAADDGSGTPGNENMYDSWGEADNRAFFLNGLGWAANVR